MSRPDKHELDELRIRYSADRPIYSALANEVIRRLTEGARSCGLLHHCYGRAKEVDSFVKKALQKGYPDPYNDIRDKAGVRLILTYLDDLELAEDLIRQIFTVKDYTNKSDQLGEQELGYHGVHFEVELIGRTGFEVAGNSVDATGYICEIQVQTRAQNLWNDISHALLYKPEHPMPEDVRRRIYRLVALMEIFDDELMAARHAVRGQPISEPVSMASLLEHHYHELTDVPFSSSLSLDAIEWLRELLSDDEAQRFGEVIRQFVDRHENQLKEMYSDYSQVVAANPFIFQPESILILERLEHDPFELRDRWASEYPLSLLEELAEIWGAPID